MSLLGSFVQGFSTPDNVRDPQHASRLFVGDNFKLAPRQGFLYHVFFDLDPSIKRVGNQEQIEAGMLVKQANLPKFTIDTKTLNSYNKYNIVQTKLKYDPLQISFHDDSNDIVRSLWFDYYNYYYRDADQGYDGPTGTVNPSYYKNTKYTARDNNQWGYTPRNYNNLTGTPTQQYFKAIRIYSLSRKRFAEYTLINPMITNFSHGQHQAGSSDPMGHDMTIAYETVLYATGKVSSTTVHGFADIHYDKTPSPMTVAGGGTRSILGEGGLLDSGVQALNSGSLAGGLFKAFRGYQNLKNTDLAATAKKELTSLGMDILKGNNPLNRIFVPNAGNLAGGSPIYEYGKGTPYPAPTNAANDAISNGQGIGIAGGEIRLAGTALAGIGASVLSGDLAGGLKTAGGLVLGSGSLDKMIKLDPLTGAVSGVGQLPSLTSARSLLSSIPGAGPTNFADITFPDDGAPSSADVSAATEAGYDAQYDVANNGTSTSTNPEGATAPATYYEADGTVSTTDITTATADSSPATAQTETLNSAAQAAADAKLVPLTDAETAALFAETNPAITMNTSTTGTTPTNQATIGATPYTGPTVVYAADGSSSPVDALGNVLKPLINGSYNRS